MKYTFTSSDIYQELSEESLRVTQKISKILAKVNSGFHKNKGRNNEIHQMS